MFLLNVSIFFFSFLFFKNVQRTKKKLNTWEKNCTENIGLFLPWLGSDLWPHDHDDGVVKCFVIDLLYLPCGVVDVHGVMMSDFVDGAIVSIDPTVFDVMTYHSCKDKQIFKQTKRNATHQLWDAFKIMFIKAFLSHWNLVLVTQIHVWTLTPHQNDVVDGCAVHFVLNTIGQRHAPQVDH